MNRPPDIRRLLIALVLGLLATGVAHAQTLPAFDATWVALPVAGTAAFVADANGDGRLDILVATAADTGYVIPATAPGTFGAPVPSVFGALLGVADFNGDGIADIVRGTYTFGSYGIQVALGDGAYGFTPSSGFGRPKFSTTWTGDVTGDGKVDIVIVGVDASYEFPNIQVRAGRGDGTFGAPVTSAVGTFATSLGLTDTNGDGRADLVFVTNTSELVVFTAAPDGSLMPGVHTAVPSGFECAAVHDLNGDGLGDVLYVAAYGLGTAAYPYLGDGSGAFLARNTDGPQPIVVDAPTARAACGDFDGDGALDAVTASDPAGGRLMSGVGDGRMRGNAADPFDTPDRISSFSVADFDGDGAAELVVTQKTVHAVGVLRSPARSLPRIACLRAEVQRPNVRLYWHSPFPLAYTASVYRSRNGGAWSLLGSALVDSATGDASYVNTGVTSDGTLGYRILATSSRGSRITGELALRSSPTACVDVPVAAGPDRLIAYELNGDAQPDLVAISSLSGTTASVLLGQPGGGFAPEREHLLCGPIWDAACADVDADGFVDLVTVSPANGDTPGMVSFAYGKAGGSFDPVRRLVTGASPRWLDVADYDRDGALDLGISSVTGSVAVCRGQGDRTFTAPRQCYSAAFPADVRSGDFDEDGVLDLAIVVPGNPTTLELHRGNGDGTFGLATSYRCPHDSHGLLVADLDGDHHLDAVLSEYTPDSTGAGARAWLFRGDGHGALAAPVTFAVPNGTHHWIAADVSGDSIPDLIVHVSSYTWPAYVYTYRNLGNFTFAAPVIRYVNDGASWPFANVVAGDFDRDGRTDLAVADAADGVVTLFYATPGAWLDVPRPPAAVAPALRLLGARPSPARAGDVRLAFTLRSTGAATLELFDVQGRRVLATPVTDPAPGTRVLALPHDRPLAPGVYLARLAQDGAHATGRVVVTR